MTDQQPSPPPPPFRSTTPGYSVVLPDEPKKSRAVVVLLLVGSLAAAFLIVGVASMSSKEPMSRFIDSQAAITAAPTSSTISLVPGEVEFLATRSPIDHGDFWFDLSELSVEMCFDLIAGASGTPVVEHRDCGAEHFYQLYAVGEVPSGFTEYSDVNQFYLGFCAAEFARFVGHAGVYSRFRAAGTIPDSSEFPELRTVTCYLYVPGELAWIGSAENSRE